MESQASDLWPVYRARLPQEVCKASEPEVEVSAVVDVGQQMFIQGAGDSK